MNDVANGVGTPFLGRRGGLDCIGKILGFIGFWFSTEGRCERLDHTVFRRGDGLETCDQRTFRLADFAEQGRGCEELRLNKVGVVVFWKDVGDCGDGCFAERFVFGRKSGDDAPGAG